MATIFEMARALGEELQKTPQVEALVAAKAAYESDPEIAKLVEEYTKLHYDFEAKMNAGGISIEEQRAFNVAGIGVTDLGHVAAAHHIQVSQTIALAGARVD